MVLSGASGLASTYLALLGETRGIAGAGYYFTILAMIMLVLRPLSGRLSDRRGLALTLVPALACEVVGLALIAAAHSAAQISCAAIFLAVALGCGQPSLQAACIRKLGKARSSVATGTYYLGADVGQGFGPMPGISPNPCRVCDFWPGGRAYLA